MGDMYRIDLSNLPDTERKKYEEFIDKVSEDLFFTNQVGIFDSFWTGQESIYDIIKLPEGCSIKKI